MSEPIKVGDLVVVVRDRCGQYLGDLYTVLGFESFPTLTKFNCLRCGITHQISLDESMTTIRADRGYGEGNIPLQWLKRIPPLEELEGQRTEETIREPA